MKQIEVVAAIIRQDDKVFATQRGYGDYKDWWEFPGGKMEAGETPEEALKREISEELSTEISVDEFLCSLESIAFTLNHIWLQDHGTEATTYPKLEEENMQMPMAAENIEIV